MQLNVFLHGFGQPFASNAGPLGHKIKHTATGMGQFESKPAFCEESGELNTI